MTETARIKSCERHFSLCHIKYILVCHLPHEPPGGPNHKDDEGQGDEDGEDGDHSVIIGHPLIMESFWNRNERS